MARQAAVQAMPAVVLIAPEQPLKSAHLKEQY
jgi:hypothetical protein